MIFWPLCAVIQLFMRWVSILRLFIRPRIWCLAISVQRGGVVEIIANDQGHRITPSWVSFTDDERLYVYLPV